MFKEIYEKLLQPDETWEEPNELGEFEICCPFHDDSNPSMSINDASGAWYCFSCAKGGGVVEMIQKHRGWSKPSAEKWIEKEFPDLFKVLMHTAKEKGIKIKKEQPPIEPVYVRQWNKMLNNSKRTMDFLLNKRGLLPETINKFMLGWDGERITIPVTDEQGNYRNIRRYLPNAKANEKFISYKAGYGSARLYPVENLTKGGRILLCEGEMDTLLACQIGYNAVTATGGAGSWKNEWNAHFKGKKVYICYDIDEEGKKGAARVAQSLSEVAEEIRIIHLPIVEPHNADLTDYLVRYGHSREDLDNLIADSEIHKPPNEDQSEPLDEKVYKVHLSEASKSQYYFKRIQTDAVVSGKDLAPFLIPKKINFNCTCDGGKSCVFCPLQLAGGKKLLEIKPTDSGILQLIDCSEPQQKGFLKQRAGIPKNCSKFEMDIVESQNVEEVSLLPELDFSSQDREYVIRRAFYIGHGLASNASYRFEGITVPDPWRQYATHIIYDAQPSQDNISSFSMTPAKRDRLKIFQPKNGQTVSEKFAEIHNDLTYNVTHIYGREDVLTALDLVYHSALAFNFQGQKVNRGWVEGLIIGDTRTGKSESAQTILQHYKLGEFVTGENTSFAGLIGGMQQTQKRWSITWGKIPLNDRRLIVLDEASGLPEDSISHMSGVRSSGIAEITKIQTEKTHARTRLIWLSNSRDGRPLKEYGYGIQAIQRLIGKSEDISRFEFALTCASEEVPMELINKKIEYHGEVPHKYTYNLCKDLILWIWSRTPEQITFQEEATDLILGLATKMGQEYSSKVPLVEGANQRIKLARLAISVAARVFSSDKTGETVIVKPEHVKYVYDYLTEIYKKPSMGYWDFSRQQKESEDIAKRKSGEVLLFLDNKPDLANLFMQYDCVTISDIEYITDQDREEVKNDIKFLAKNRMISKTRNGFKKTPAYGKILKSWKVKKRKDGE